jgi:ADP-ribose pyrophosphatase YjhB (NUDIX family)
MLHCVQHDNEDWGGMEGTSMIKRNSHCGWCGHEYEGDPPWPRRCSACGHTSYLNPLPVAVILVPVDRGVLAIRRTVAPEVGMLALPGGYINLGETWQEAGAREVWEETGLRLDPAEIRDFAVLTADGYLLVFGLAASRTAADLPPFTPTNETSERVVLPGPADLAFSLHTQALAMYFAARAGAEPAPPAAGSRA